MVYVAHHADAVPYAANITQLTEYTETIHTQCGTDTCVAQEIWVQPVYKSGAEVLKKGLVQCKGARLLLADILHHRDVLLKLRAGVIYVDLFRPVDDGQYPTFSGLGPHGIVLAINTSTASQGDTIVLSATQSSEAVLSSHAHTYCLCSSLWVGYPYGCHSLRSEPWLTPVCDSTCRRSDESINNMALLSS